jgi:hypothetical protein
LTLEDRTEGRLEEGRITAESRRTPNDTFRAAREHSAEIHGESSDNYRKLFFLDIEMHARLQTVTDAVNQLHLADGQQVLGMLTVEYETMTTMQEEVRHMQVSSDACNEEFRHAILGTLEEMRLAVKSIMDVIAHRATNDDLDSAKIVDTGETQLVGMSTLLNHK